MKKEKNILIIGGAGYIGSHVVLEFCNQGENVYVFDDLSLGKKTNIDKRAELIKGSIFFLGCSLWRNAIFTNG